MKQSRPALTVLLVVVSLILIAGVLALTVPVVRCSTCSPLYDAILGPDQPSEDWRIDCLNCDGHRRVSLVRAKFGPRGELANQWLICLLRGEDHASLPKRDEPLNLRALEVMRRSLPILIRALKAKDHGVRFRAGYLIGHIGPPAVDVLPQLIEAARADPDSPYLWALGRLEAEPRRVLPIFIAVLRSPRESKHGSDVMDAVDGLGCLGPAAREAVPDLIPLLRRGDHPLRAAVITTFCKIGPAAAEAIPELTRATADPDPLLSRIAATALREVSR